MCSHDLKLLIGLGNPGVQYHKTRHNVGFMVLEEIARLNNCSFRESKKIYGKTCEIGSGLQKTRLLMPTTYMNESGKSVRSAKDWFNFDNHQLIVLVDDMDLPLGKIRVRSKGSSGGHNGLKSIIEQLKTHNFNRIRIGIGSPPLIQGTNNFNTISHVLGNISQEEKTILDKVYKRVITSLEELNSKNEDSIINELNSFDKNKI